MRKHRPTILMLALWLASALARADEFGGEDGFDDFDDSWEAPPTPHYVAPGNDNPPGPMDSPMSMPPAGRPSSGNLDGQVPPPVAHEEQPAPPPEVVYDSVPAAPSAAAPVAPLPRAPARKSKPRAPIKLEGKSGVSITSSDAAGPAVVAWKTSSLSEKQAREWLARAGFALETTSTGKVIVHQSSLSGKTAAPNAYLRFQGSVFPGFRPSAANASSSTPDKPEAKLGAYDDALLYSSTDAKRAKVRFYRLVSTPTRLADLAKAEPAAFKAAYDQIAGALRQETLTRFGWAPENVGFQTWLEQGMADLSARREYLQLRVGQIAKSLEGSARVSELISHLRDADNRMKISRPPAESRELCRRILERAAGLESGGASGAKDKTTDLAQLDAIFDRGYQGSVRTLQSMDQHSLRMELLRTGASAGSDDPKARLARLAAAGFSDSEASLAVDYGNFVWMAPNSGLIDAFEINLLRALARQAAATFESAAGAILRKLSKHRSDLVRAGGQAAIRDILRDITGFMYDRKITLHVRRGGDYDGYLVRGKIEALLRERAARRSHVLEWDSIEAATREIYGALAGK